MHRLFLVPTTGAIVIALLLSACSAYEPEVLGVSTLELRYLTLDGTRSEELVLELEVRDQDGFSELDRIYVVQDEAELFWDFPSESWQTRPAEGEIRLLRLASPGDEALPRGRYRVELFDLGGRSGEGSFTLPLLPAGQELEALEERVLIAGAHVRELLRGAPGSESSEEETPEQEGLPKGPPGAEALEDIGLLFFPAGGVAPQQLLNLESLGALDRAERENLLATTLERISGEAGRLYLGARAGDAGPLLLLALQELAPRPSGEVSS